MAKKNCKKDWNSTYVLNENKLKVLRCYDCATPESQQFMADELGMSLSTFSYHLIDLREKNFVDKNNVVTEKGRQVIQYFDHGDKIPPLKLRAHKLQISFKVTKSPTNFKSLQNKIISCFTNNRYKGYKAMVSGCQVMFYGTSKIVCFLPDILGQNETEILGKIRENVLDLREKIEEEFAGIKLGTYEVAKFESMHIAIVDSEIAKEFLQKSPSHRHGRFAVDNSNNQPELEVEQLDTIGEDLEKIVKYEELKRENEQLKNGKQII